MGALINPPDQIIMEKNENNNTQDVEAAAAVVVEDPNQDELKQCSAVQSADQPAAEEIVAAVSIDKNTAHPPAPNVSVLQSQPRHIPSPIEVVGVSSTQPPPPPQPQPISLNSRRYTNRISLLLFLLHLLAAMTAVSFFIFKAIQVLLDTDSKAHFRRSREKRALRYWLPPIEATSVLAIALAFAWQRSIRAWPNFMISFVLWSTFAATMSAGILLLCFAIPAASGLGIALVLFSIGTALYSCWATVRVPFTAKVFSRALVPIAKFSDLNGPAYLMMGAGFLWISLWCFAVIGAQSFYYPALTIFGLVLSLAWTVEVMRNVVNLTVSRVISLYYLRGMQSNTQFCFQRAMTVNLGSAALGSLFVPTIEAFRIMARGFNLMEEEDEFMFSCAHCCLRVMEYVFHYGNSWAFVHIAAYGKGFVSASKSTWGLFERQRMEELVDSDMSSSVCFLTGVSSGALCVILSASWTYATHRQYTATVTLLAFFVGYLMTRIAMALPQACVACYYVCYAENPGMRLFDSTIPDRLNQMRSDLDVLVSTPRFPRRR